ncbi:MAG: site-2 protease family protein [Zetaproteobacteria bacterium CG_4_9_14_3_um_filter_49_83]|nr:MAG: site-2 protease family protein [Zetaproteobacteria bacterium CG02_land_8_20_14_3_00_50_9]PIY57202.1 MAG: site-2 protease family protein [Zetaproteobacteria bacterium CG_4_10_14_0_8_um_filter_49_80]PJA35413.1 MAG: site-2 protease family protein [Zetaproteobacteria bacterium CG_4_9_14_3_um_filter_49_83]
MADIQSIMQGISIWALPVLLAIVLHEVAHGWMAYKLGDDTAFWLGRLSLNPLRHIDPVGTIVIPLVLVVAGSPFLFGYAKPVPINWRKLRNPKRDMVWVALAGPLTNILLAIISTFLLWLVAMMPASWVWAAEPLSLMLQASILINLVLCIFNLLPLPPLDGGRVAVGLLPQPYSTYLSGIEPYGFMIIVALLLLGILQDLIGPLVMLGAQLLLGLAL